MEVLSGARIGLPPTLHLSQGPPENHCRPAADCSSVQRPRSTARRTGCGAHRMARMECWARVYSRARRSVLAQDQASSAVWECPRSGQRGLAHKVLPLNAIAAEILRLASRRNGNARASESVA